ncbi:uncharacterized protein LOC126319962 [Schistocerca gregaria]|uniref:uncharacterized protein LOC126319962 n=1 Tax=Schistocerca gregaria TaxID=7010 RepID=UPI00211DA7A4|nr:uncharacterized protein LOC126319962 [Schistocerca gregaria]
MLFNMFLCFIIKNIFCWIASIIFDICLKKSDISFEQINFSMKQIMIPYLQLRGEAFHKYQSPIQVQNIYVTKFCLSFPSITKVLKEPIQISVKEVCVNLLFKDSLETFRDQEKMFQNLKVILVTIASLLKLDCPGLTPEVDADAVNQVKKNMLLSAPKMGFILKLIWNVVDNMVFKVERICTNYEVLSETSKREHCLICLVFSMGIETTDKNWVKAFVNHYDINNFRKINISDLYLSINANKARNISNGKTELKKIEQFQNSDMNIDCEMAEHILKISSIEAKVHIHRGFDINTPKIRVENSVDTIDVSLNKGQYRLFLDAIYTHLKGQAKGSKLAGGQSQAMGINTRKAVDYMLSKNLRVDVDCPLNDMDQNKWYTSPPNKKAAESSEGQIDSQSSKEDDMSQQSGTFGILAYFDSSDNALFHADEQH